MKKPNLFRYDNYRHFLRDWFAWMKEVKPGFSHRAFSHWAGFHSPNQLLLVIQGKRNIALPSLGRYFKTLKLNKTESRYFEALVKFNQADDMTAKKGYFHELSTYWLRKGSFLEPRQYDYLSHWHYTAIREMVSLKDFVENGTWIAKKLGSLITPGQAKEAVAGLLGLGLLKRNPNGRLAQTAQYVTTGDEVASVAAHLYHEQMMVLALESLKKVPSSERNITALTFTMRKEDYGAVVDEINACRKRIVAALQNREAPAHGGDDALYQLNLHLFPVTKG